MPRGYPDDHYRIVARLYSDAEVSEFDLVGAKTEHSVKTTAVHRHFPWASYTAAESWVRTARVKGFL